ncbi:hypothetical protein [Streptomyces sp. NPDC058092]|uniref:hypothetical protein n=1 Tax=Streptomyces sp. NPDC058092 TaxID=3346336 RepID=UPI0036E04EFB
MSAISLRTSLRTSALGAVFPGAQPGRRERPPISRSPVSYDAHDAGRGQVRFTFCKKDEVLSEAVDRLRQLRG